MRNIGKFIISFSLLFAVAGCTSSGNDFFASLWNDVVSPDGTDSAQIADQPRMQQLALPAGFDGAQGAESEEAAALGDASAQHRLGYRYASGDGVARDPVAAYAWLNLAVHNLPPGMEHDRAVANRETVARDMNPAEITEAHRLTGEWAVQNPQTPALMSEDITIETDFQDLARIIHGTA